jgi:Ca-activated chloride channel family protein
VILATDGDFNVGVSSKGDLESLIEEKENQVFFLRV